VLWRVGGIVKKMCLCDVWGRFVGILKKIFVSCVVERWWNFEDHVCVMCVGDLMEF
jgi:hypothetical protein